METKYIKKIKPVYLAAVIVIAFACIVIGAAQIGHAGKTAETSDSMIVTFDEDSLQKMRQTDAQDVCNVITNMQNGDVKSGDAKDYIFDKKFFAKKVMDCTTDEMKVNLRYIAFLDAAKAYVVAFECKSNDMKDKFDLMNEKKDLI